MACEWQVERHFNKKERVLSPEHKKKLSDINKLRWAEKSEEEKTKIYRDRKGKTLSLEIRGRMMARKRLTEEERKKKRKEYMKEYWEKSKEKNKEKRKEYRKEYDKKNKEKIKEYQKEYREKNKEKINMGYHEDIQKAKIQIIDYIKKREPCLFRYGFIGNSNKPNKETTIVEVEMIKKEIPFVMTTILEATKELINKDKKIYRKKIKTSDKTWCFVYSTIEELLDNNNLLKVIMEKEEELLKNYQKLNIKKECKPMNNNTNMLEKIQAHYGELLKDAVKKTADKMNSEFKAILEEQKSKFYTQEKDLVKKQHKTIEELELNQNQKIIEIKTKHKQDIEALEQKQYKVLEFEKQRNEHFLSEKNERIEELSKEIISLNREMVKLKDHNNDISHQLSGKIEQVKSLEAKIIRLNEETNKSQQEEENYLNKLFGSLKSDINSAIESIGVTK